MTSLRMRQCNGIVQVVGVVVLGTCYLSINNGHSNIQTVIYGGTLTIQDVVKVDWSIGSHSDHNNKKMSMIMMLSW